MSINLALRKKGGGVKITGGANGGATMRRSLNKEGRRAGKEKDGRAFSHPFRLNVQVKFSL
ncbi:MAG: hypothetical protein IPK83_00725 [Planctomycetes bacterium]|nr:hypothetical protein [Planctomycetota bacterium]